jgi:hypothetical protein
MLLNPAHPVLNTTEGSHCIITDINPLVPELNAKCDGQETSI